MFLALDAALATRIVNVTANAVTIKAYTIIGPKVSAVPNTSLKIAVITWFKARAATKPNAAVISTANLSKISFFIVFLLSDNFDH